MSRVGGPKNAYFVHSLGKNCPRSGRQVVKKGQNYVHVVVECPLVQVHRWINARENAVLVAYPSKWQFRFHGKKGKVEKPHQISKLGKQLLMKCFLLFQKKMGYFTEHQHRIVKVSIINIVEKINKLIRKIFHSWGYFRQH